MNASKPFQKSASGKVNTKASSNIALIKYWGKYPVQLPANASISYTLSQSFTETEIEYEMRGNFGISFFFEGKENLDFAKRIEKYLKSIEEYLPFISTTHFTIHSRNTFPHSSGIASSASAFAALAKGLVAIEAQLKETFIVNIQKASFLARLGSGSACRSIYPGLVVWGKSEWIAGSSDEYAIPYPENIPKEFIEMNDAIAIIHEGVKSVSSSVGHGLMEGHPFAESRFQQANQNMGRLIKAINEGDIFSFGAVIENEALSLHAMMMTSNPSYILMQPNTVKVIESVRKFRKETQTPIFFTLDAGANVHILYPQSVEAKVRPFLESDIRPLCAQGRIIEDSVQV